VSPQPYNLVIRPYRLEDQENVEVIGDLCYPPNIETTESFLAKLEIGDSFVAVDSVTGVTAAYCIGLPWHKEPLPINASPTKESFEGADVYVVHDIAVHPDWRGAGLASSLLEKLLSCARERAFAKAVLVAINPTARIVWGKKGFVPMSCANDSGGYGPLATKMELFL
jgi:GNAT superfamily N-acetyltransferase